MLRNVGLAVVVFSMVLPQVVEASLLVWSDYTGSTGNVRTANPDGTNVAVIATNASGGVAVDNLTGRVYWGASNGLIYGANIDGSSQTLVASTGSSIVWNMFVDNGQLYFNSLGASGSQGVGRVGVDGTGLVRIGDNIGGEGLAFDPDTQTVYYQHFGLGAEPFGTIKTVAASGGSPAKLANQPNLGFVPGLFVDTVQDKLYYATASQSAIYSSNLDGSSLSLIANIPDSYGAEYSIYVDSPNNTIYYGIRGTGTIGRMDLDGTHQQTLLTSSGNFYAMAFYDTGAPVPEPAAFAVWALFGTAGMTAGYCRRRRALAA